MNQSSINIRDIPNHSLSQGCQGIKLNTLLPMDRNINRLKREKKNTEPLMPFSNSQPLGTKFDENSPAPDKGASPSVMVPSVCLTASASDTMSSSQFNNHDSSNEGTVPISIPNPRAITSSSPIIQVLNYIVRMQDQLERVVNLQTEGTMAINRLSQSLLKITCEMEGLKRENRLMKELQQQQMYTVLNAQSMQNHNMPQLNLWDDALNNTTICQEMITGFLDGDENNIEESTIDPAVLLPEKELFSKNEELINLMPFTTMTANQQQFRQRKARVLLVEDDLSYQYLVKKHLESKGIDCVVASTAQEALLRFTEMRESLTRVTMPFSPSIPTMANLTFPGEFTCPSYGFDLILMDIQLPGSLNGISAAQRIRSIDQETPIISMTSSTAPKQVATYYASGMNDVLPKPFTKAGLLNLVSRFCSLKLEGDEQDEDRVKAKGGLASQNKDTFPRLADNYTGNNSFKARTYTFGSF